MISRDAEIMEPSWISKADTSIDAAAIYILDIQGQLTCGKFETENQEDEKKLPGNCFLGSP